MVCCCGGQKVWRAAFQPSLNIEWWIELLVARATWLCSFTIHSWGKSQLLMAVHLSISMKSSTWKSKKSTKCHPRPICRNTYSRIVLEQFSQRFIIAYKYLYFCRETVSIQVATQTRQNFSWISPEKQSKRANEKVSSAKRVECFFVFSGAEIN